MAATAVTPANGSTITTNTPTLGMTITVYGANVLQKGQWQWATDSGFASVIATVTETNDLMRVSGATSKVTNTSLLNLSSGTRYLRARTVDSADIGITAWTATQTITVTVTPPAVPTALVPANGTLQSTTKPVISAHFAADARGIYVYFEASLTLGVPAYPAAGTLRFIGDSGVGEGGASVSAGTGVVKYYTTSGPFKTAGVWYITAYAVTSTGIQSARTAIQNFTLDIPGAPIPTAVTPVTGSTTSTATPTLGANVTPPADGRLVSAEWMLATDSAFTTNVKVIAENHVYLPGAVAAPYTASVPIPVGSKLSQGLWYLKCRAQDENGAYGSYSATQSFTVSHIPSASGLTPGSDKGYLYAATTPFTWAFSDPSSIDSQTAYQILIERNDTGANVVDTGKVTSAVKAANAAIPVGMKAIKLRWKIRVWDTDDVVGSYSGYQLFTVADIPVVTITSPVDSSVLATGKPTISWTMSAGSTQVNYQIFILDQQSLTYIYQSGLVASTLKTWTPPAPILRNNGSYSLTVTVGDNYDLYGSATCGFTTSYPAPPDIPVNIDPLTYDTLGYITLDWTASSPDAFFVSWNVYRQLNNGNSPWEKIYTTADPSVRSYHDWKVQSGYQYNYAVTQIAGRSGEDIESSFANWVQAVNVATNHYWLINPYDETQNVRINQVTADTYTAVYDEAELLIIGRGRKMNQGTRFGVDGSLTFQLRDSLDQGTARDQKKRIQAIKASQTAMFLRDPFGNLTQIAIGSISATRISGVGGNEFMDVTLPYKEIM